MRRRGRSNTLSVFDESYYRNILNACKWLQLAEHDSARHLISREWHSDQVHSDGLEDHLCPVASLEDLCRPRPAVSPSWNGVSLEPFENFDRYGPGFEILGTEEELFRGSQYEGFEWWKSPEMETSVEDAQNIGYDGGEKYEEVEWWKAPKTEISMEDERDMDHAGGEDLSSSRTANTNTISHALADTREDYGLGFSIVKDPAFEEEGKKPQQYWESFGAAERRHSSELEVPEEDYSRSLRSVATSSTATLYLSPDQSKEKRSPSGSTNSLFTSVSTPQDRHLENKWPCGFPNCCRTFPRRHLLNRHLLYHAKPYRCLELSCASRRGFSLRKDLKRHQLTHNPHGHRYYCPHERCTYAANGAQNGFLRKDHQKRHVDNQHKTSPH